MSDFSTEELLQRYGSIIKKYVELAGELAPKLEQFGKYREELQFLTIEFTNRGVTPETPEALVKLLETELQSRESK